MKVILKQDMENLGESGTVVEVKPGYARNYLLPQGLAYPATEENLARVQEEQRLAEEAAKRDYLEAKRRASQLDKVSLTFEVNAGEGGKLFGSVTSGDIAEKIVAEADLDFEFDKRSIQLDEPIKELGTIAVGIKLHTEVIAEVEVAVVAAEG